MSNCGEIKAFCIETHVLFIDGIRPLVARSIVEFGIGLASLGVASKRRVKGKVPKLPLMAAAA